MKNESGQIEMIATIQNASDRILTVSESRIATSMFGALATGKKLTESELAALVVGRKQTKISILRLMLGGLVIQRSGEGTKASPFIYFIPYDQLETPSDQPIQVNAFSEEDIQSLSAAFEILMMARNQRDTA